MDSKDACARLEGGGGGARCRCGNGRRSAAAAAMFVSQSLLTAVFATFSIYIFLNTPTPQKDNGIYMYMTDNSERLRFGVLWNESVELIDETRISLTCGGPYMVYMWARMRSIDTKVVANLTIKQGGELIHQQMLKNGPQEMQSVFMLSEKSEITLKVESIKDTTIIEKLNIGLHYMLGDQCFPSLE